MEERYQAENDKMGMKENRIRRKGINKMEDKRLRVVKHKNKQSHKAHNKEKEKIKVKMSGAERKWRERDKGNQRRVEVKA